MSLPLPPAPYGQHGSLRDLADRALDLVVNTVGADPADPQTSRVFVRLAHDLRTRLEPFLRQRAAGADEGVLTAIRHLHELLQTFLADADGTNTLDRVAERLCSGNAILTGAVNRLHELVTERLAQSVRVVVQDGFGQPVRVRGVEKPALTFAQHKVIEALLEAGETGLSKDELEAVHSDARGILRRLRDRDLDWRAVIHFAGRTGGRYRVG
jgi:hypothetical protein